MAPLCFACGDDGAGSSSTAGESRTETSATDTDSDSASASDSNAEAGTDSNSGDGDGEGATDSDSATASATDTDSATDTATDSATATDSGDGDGDGGTATNSGDGDGDSGTDTDTDSGDGDGDGGTGTGDGDGDDGILCNNVDVIFAVDNSHSMQEAIAVLEGPVFAALPEALLQVGNGIEDFHLAVINGCPKPGYFFNTGEQGACNFSTGGNYMTSDSPSLDDEYACVMDLINEGYNGMPQECEDLGPLKDDNEQPASTAAAALSPENLAGPNQGFLRDDALLFVVNMTDEDEELIDAQGNDVLPQTIVDQIVAAKGPIENVVMLSIGGLESCQGPYGSAFNAKNLRDVTQPFIDVDRGLYWDICDGNLEVAFEQAIEILDQACFELQPQ